MLYYSIYRCLGHGDYANSQEISNCKTILFSFVVFPSLGQHQNREAYQTTNNVQALTLFAGIRNF